MNAVLVDTSVALDVFTDSERFFAVSHACLTQWGATHELWINSLIYAESRSVSGA